MDGPPASRSLTPLWVAAGTVSVFAAVAGVVLLNQPARGPLPGLPGSLPPGDRDVTLPSNGRTRFRLVVQQDAAGADGDSDDDGHGHGDGNGNGNAPVRRRRRRRVVVIIPGISYPMDCMRTIFDDLVQAGHSVLLYDVTGRGYSHSSGAPMSMRLYVRQLEELLSALGLDGDGTGSAAGVVAGDGSAGSSSSAANSGEPCELDIVGWSMGSVIATHFALAHPDRVRRLVLLAPPGGAPAHKPLTASLTKLPLGVGAALGNLFVKGTLKKLYKQELGATPADGGLLDTLLEHVDANPGLPRAVLSTLRNCPELDDNRAVLAAVGAHQRPVLVQWGARDATVRRAAVDALVALLPRARLAEHAELGHTMFLAAPRQTVPEIVEFLGGGM